MGCFASLEPNQLSINQLNYPSNLEKLKNINSLLKNHWFEIRSLSFEELTQQ